LQVRVVGGVDLAHATGTKPINDPVMMQRRAPHAEPRVRA
jgi:hypothetical protein